MIAPNELRIGNYFYGCGWFGEKPRVLLPIETEFFRVTEISITGVHEILPQRRVNKYWPFSKIEGIPITEEWFEKFGFKWVTDQTDPLEFMGHWTKGLFAVTLLDFQGFSFVWKQSNCDIEIKHVHQLQNLHFALTGEELTIKES